MSNGWLPDLPWRRRANVSTLALTIADASVRYVFASDSTEQGATIISWGTELRGSQTREAFLARVKGIGPALLARLAPHIRFSGVAAGNAPVTGAPREGRRRSKRVSGHALGEQAALDRPLSRREF